MNRDEAIERMMMIIQTNADIVDVDHPRVVEALNNATEDLRGLLNEIFDDVAATRRMGTE